MKLILVMAMMMLVSCFEKEQTIALDISSLKKIDIELKKGTLVITKSLDKTEFTCKKGSFNLDKEKNILKTSDDLIDCVLRFNNANVSLMMDEGNVTVDDIDGNVSIKANVLNLYTFKEDLTPKMAYVFPKDRKFFFAQEFMDYFYTERSPEHNNIIIDADKGYAQLVDPKKLEK